MQGSFSLVFRVEIVLVLYEFVVLKSVVIAPGTCLNLDTKQEKQTNKSARNNKIFTSPAKPEIWKTEHKNTARDFFLQPSRDYAKQKQFETKVRCVFQSRPVQEKLSFQKFFDSGFPRKSKLKDIL